MADETLTLRESRRPSIGILICRSRLTPLIGKPCGLRAHNNCRGTAHISVVVGVRILELSCEDLDIAFLQVPDTFRRTTSDCGYGENRTYRSPDEIGVVEVGQRVADNHGISSGGIGRAENGTEVTRFLYTLQHNDQRVGREAQVAECDAPCTHHGHHSFCGPPIGYALIDGRADNQDVGIREPDIGGQEFRADKELNHFITSLQTMLQFTPAFDDEEASAATLGRFLLQGKQILYPRVLGTCYYLFQMLFF